MLSPHKTEAEDTASITSTSHESDTTVTSTSNSSYASSIDEVQLKINQMKRHNKKKGQTSKLMAKYKAHLTPEQRAQNEMNKRIDQGLRQVLHLHTPVELSSICGVLNLPALQRASVSIDQIINFCKQENEFSEVRIMKAVNNMWEGALFEYLKSIGHPQKTCLPDPKLAVMKIWRRGGFHESESDTFTPHYIQKRVLTRHDTDQAEDIASRSAKLKVMENAMKHVERELFEEHDYTNALRYFQQLGEIRKTETDFRDYLINKLELCRSELSRANSNKDLATEMLAEGEDRYCPIDNGLRFRL